MAYNNSEVVPLICPNGHKFERPLILRSGDNVRIVCPICKECGVVFEKDEKKPT